MPGPLPKPPAARRYKGKARGLPSEPLPASRRPKLPTRRPAWHKATREWWQTVWASPMAHVWIDTDRLLLLRLAHLIDLVWQGEASAAVLREVRLSEDALGLTPYGRRRLEWYVDAPGSGAAKPPPARLADARRRRLSRDPREAS